MGIISLDQAEPSMVLAAPVLDRNGRLLIPVGKVLSDRHLESLRMWGITSVEVEGESRSEVEGDQIDPELVMEAERLVAENFSGHDLTHPFISALSRYCVRRKAGSLQEARVNADGPARKGSEDA